MPELGDLLPHLFGVPGQGHGFEHPFEALALALLHLLDLVRAGEIRRRGAGQRLRLLQPFFEPPPRRFSRLFRSAWVLDASRRWYSDIRKPTRAGARVVPSRGGPSCSGASRSG